MVNVRDTVAAPREERDAPLDAWSTIEGSSSPLGARWIASQQAWNFAICARHATSVTLLLHSAADVVTPILERPLDPLRHRSGRVWHCRIPQADAPSAAYYAYRVDGPRDRRAGHRFSPDKVLLDPFADGVFFPPGFSRTAAMRVGQNAGRAPLGVLPRPLPAFDWQDDRPPHHTHDLVIYEMHVRGLTRHPGSGVPAPRAGTFAGVIEKVPHLKQLGVTAVELMPVQQFDPQERNYWGYMTLNFFAPHQQYAAGGLDGTADEFREMVRALHAADIEVVLDVVYNHTAESGDDGPTYSYRGIDNSTYYLLDMSDGSYRNDAGTGNVLRTAHPHVRQMVIESLRYWVREMHVDGFRFDLASIFTRRHDGSIDLEEPPIISEISADPDFANVRLIAEAWDVSAYQLGRSFPGSTWLQWNGRFRDDVRSFVKSDEGMVPALMRRLYGSDDLFPGTAADAYRPVQSVNFVTAHDGFCLHDLVAYNTKHNEPNGHGNTDGTNDHRSWNCGWEGEDGTPEEVLALRHRQAKNFCSLLMLSNGTPMFCAGDEFLHTQRGNNNPYNQDNDTSWLDWSRLISHDGHFRFFREMIAFRKRHPSIARSRFWREDVRWYGVQGSPDLSVSSRTLAYFLHGASLEDDDLYVMINAFWEPLVFSIQEGPPGSWSRAVDTFLPAPADICNSGDEPVVPGSTYLVGPRSIAVLISQSTV
jgi:glycogen operon protein